MKEIKHDETRRGYALIEVLGIAVLALLMLVSIAGATPYAYITNTGSSNVSVIDTATNKVTYVVPVGLSPIGIAVSPEGTKVYVANYRGNTVSVIDTATNKVTATVPVGSYPLGVAVTPDGTKVYVANRDLDNFSAIDTVSVIDTATNTVTSTVDIGGDPQGVAVTPDGTKVYVTNWGSGTVSVIDTSTNTVTSTVDIGGDPQGVAVSPDGTKVYVTKGNSDTISVINTATNTVTVVAHKNSDPQGVAVSPDGTKVYVADYGGNTVSVIDTATNKVTATVPVGSYPQGVAVTPDGTKVYVTNWGSGTVSVIDTSTNTVTATINGFNGACSFGQFIALPPALKPVLPVANFNVNTTEGNAPLTVQFTDLSTNATYVKWDFGDGNNSTERNPVHEFTIPGTYTVNLTASNENGTDSKLATITVLEQPVLPVAIFSAKPTSGKAPLNVVFTDESTGVPISWKWTFGDGVKSSVQNPTHKYSKVGSYTVTLTATNAEGNNTVTKTDYIKVIEKPVAKFTSNVTSGKAPLTVAFTDKSKGILTSCKWTFGDGAKSSVQNPIHQYSQEGKYKVTLTVTNAAGSSITTKTNYIKVTTNTRPGLYSKSK